MKHALPVQQASILKFPAVALIAGLVLSASALGASRLPVPRVLLSDEGCRYGFQENGECLDNDTFVRETSAQGVPVFKKLTADENEPRWVRLPHSSGANYIQDGWLKSDGSVPAKDIFYPVSGEYSCWKDVFLELSHHEIMLTTEGRLGDRVAYQGRLAQVIGVYRRAATETLLGPNGAAQTHAVYRLRLAFEDNDQRHPFVSACETSSTP